MAVALDQRSRRAGDCPICEGGDSMKRGRGLRCFGYTMRDGNAVVCTREEFAGDIPLNARAKGYVHVLDRPCKCGADHSADYRIEPLRSTPAPTRKTRKQSHLYKTPTEIYCYREDLRKLRYGHGKTKYFVWQHCDEQGEWWNCDGCDHAPGLYRPEATSSIGPLFLVEGEGKANRIAERGGRAASVPDGASSWSKEYAKILAGEHVVILVDDDDDGRTGAQLEVTDLEQTAASVRSLQIEGAHDVADWFAADHTLLELMALVLMSVCCEPRSEAVNVQDDVCPQPAKPCEQCARLEAELAIAVETIKHLNRDFFRLDRVMALDSAKVTPPVKVAAYADIRHLAQARAREDRGEKGMMLHYSREALARRTGVKVDTAGRNHNKLVDLKLIAKDHHTEPMVDERGMPVFDEQGKQLYHTTLFMGEGPLLDEVKLDEQLIAPENGWGGIRIKKACPRCGSFHLKATEYGCDDCGAIFAPDERVDVEVSDGEEANAQDGAQDTTTPLTEECDILNVHPMNSGLNHHDERAELLALVEILGYRTRLPIGLNHNEGGTLVNWQTFAAQADNALIDEALRQLRIRREAVSI